MDLDLQGKVVLVTGSSRGIGLATAQGFYAEGAKVVMNARGEDVLSASASRISPNILTICADVTNFSACKAMIKTIINHHGRLDCVVCNVGHGKPPADNTDFQLDWHKRLDMNLLSAINVIEAAKDALIKSTGNIVCISSIAGCEALKKAPMSYSVAKAALNHYIHSQSKVFGDVGVRLNAVAPGNIVFPGSGWERRVAEQSEVVEKMLSEEVALSRLGKPEEIADAVLFLASNRSAFTTGEVFVVDGGQVKS